MCLNQIELPLMLWFQLLQIKDVIINLGGRFCFIYTLIILLPKFNLTLCLTNMF